MKNKVRAEMNLRLREATKSLFKRKQIARWKIFTPTEHFLSFLADKSEFFKRLYVAYYKLFDKEYYSNGLKIIEREISKFKPEISVSEKNKLIVDMIYSLHRFGAMFTEYFLFDFPSLNISGREAFITDKMRYAYCEILNDYKSLELFDRKEKTYELFKDYYGREVMFIDRKECYDDFDRFIKGKSSFFLKPSKGGSGKGVELVDVDKFESIHRLFDYAVSKSPCVIEEVVTNHPEIRKIYPKALSTIRVPTITTTHGTQIFATYIRFGKGGSIKDNVGSGDGIIAVIDLNSGIIESPAFDKVGTKHLVHPDTQQKIIGFEVPEWSSALQLAKELSQVVKQNRYVGWDLAYTENGWIMIEGNGRGEFYGQQFPDRKGKRDWLDELVMQ